MPRLRVQARESAEGVPLELLYRGEPLWEDVEASEEWFGAHGLRPAQIFHIGPACRRQEAIWQWIIANSYGQEKYPVFPDWGRLEELGIEGRWQSDAMRERLAAVRDSR